MLFDVDVGNDVFPPGEWAHHKERTVKTLVRFLVERDVKFPVSPRLIGHMSQPKESQVEIKTQQFRLNNF